MRLVLGLWNNFQKEQPFPNIIYPLIDNFQANTLNKTFCLPSNGFEISGIDKPLFTISRILVIICYLHSLTFMVDINHRLFPDILLNGRKTFIKSRSQIVMHNWKMGKTHFDGVMNTLYLSMSVKLMY